MFFLMFCSRFYDVSSGKVLIDDEDLRDLDPSFVRGQLIGYIHQEPVLFATTVMENIRYGRPDATDEEVCDTIVTYCLIINY